MEQQDLNKRLLLALALSFLVFTGYSYLFVPQKSLSSSKQTQVVSKVVPSPVLSSTKKVPSTVQSTSDKTIKNIPVITSNILLTIVSNTFKMDIDKLGRIVQFELLEKKYQNTEGHNLQILGKDKAKPLEIRFTDTALNEEAFKTPYIPSVDGVQDARNKAVTVTLTQTLSKVTVTKKLTVQPSGAYRLEVKLSNPVSYFVTPGHRPMADTSMYMLVRGALVKTPDGVVKTIEDGDAKGDEVFRNALIASAFDRYVTTMFYSFEKKMNVSILKEGEGEPLIFIAGKPELILGGYIGPKEYKTLEAINPELTDAIEFGWFTFLSKPFFKVLLWIHNHIGNWGWAIILFTLLVKLILFPLSYKGMMSMQKLKDLAPKMKEIREKYKDDSAKLNMKMMEMYKKHGANPMGGCLPMLLQIPVFFALYRVLLNANELQGAVWIPAWIENLATADPYYILPILMGFSMWFQQKITPNNFTDPLQEKIFQFFPVLMALMFIIMPFPSGLVLYWVVNNIFTIGQQYVINNAYQKQKVSVVVADKKRGELK
ncbi:MAG: membrane protein insertase YidC [Sulfurovum sp.]|nr:membrane protein insertase YidC [Sulfurovum sp.]MCB4750692.1 membrane protein insertase YidC [Sulfurovum sp.]MCB4753522.1 membrane protein insertase YidC [Sulfurovum sp.]MCB4758598.1 membrane protein insertase YidC [Sulfurovum sp.]MCB4760884.1 membrane protein insertase YidC [Sulfurovum sp.]